MDSNTKAFNAILLGFAFLYLAATSKLSAITGASVGESLGTVWFGIGFGFQAIILGIVFITFIAIVVSRE